jgi:competence protein ComEC
VVLRYPAKKWAALAALAGAFFYLLLSGATVPTQRAFLMLAAVLAAVVLDRTAISMRLVAWAAVLVLLVAPESLLSASFQMSFAAVTALVAVYEALSGRSSAWRSGAGRVRKLGLYVSGVLLTTVVAGLATAPFALYNFNRFALYGVAANMIAVLLTGLWVMPWAICALVLMPFGLEAVALAPMGWGIDAVVSVAETVAAWPGAVALGSRDAGHWPRQRRDRRALALLMAPALACARPWRRRRRAGDACFCPSARRAGQWRRTADGSAHIIRRARGVVFTAVKIRA